MPLTAAVPEALKRVRTRNDALPRFTDPSERFLNCGSTVTIFYASHLGGSLKTWKENGEWGSSFNRGHTLAID